MSPKSYDKRGRGRGRGRGSQLDENTNAATLTPEESHVVPAQQESNEEETQPPDSQNVQTERRSTEERQASHTIGNNDEHNWVLNDQGKKQIQPLGDSFIRATEVCRELYQIVNNHWNGPYTCLGDTPEDVKRLWFSEFSRSYSWAEGHDGEIRRIFQKKIGDHMRNVMCKAKKKGKKPAWIGHNSWTDIVRKWESEEHKKYSQRNKQNRASSSGESATATYAGGSITIGEHKRKLANSLGTTPSLSQTFDRTFRKKDQTFVSERAKAIKEKYDEILAENAGSGSAEQGTTEMTQPSEADQAKMWFEASSAVKKRGKIYGLGSLIRDCAKAFGASTSSATTSKKTADEVVSLKNVVAEKTQEIHTLNTKLDKVERNLAAVMQHLHMQSQDRPFASQEEESPPPTHVSAEDSRAIGAEEEDEPSDQDDDLGL